MPSAPAQPVSPAQPAVLAQTDNPDDFEQLNEAVSYASDYMAMDTANEFPVIEISSSDSGGSSNYAASQSTIGDSFSPFSFDISTLSANSGSSDSSGSTSSLPSGGLSGGSSSGGSSSGESSEGNTNQPADSTTNTQTDIPTVNPGTSGGGGGGLPNDDNTLDDLMAPKGIGSIFLFPNELNYNGRRLPLATAMENLLKYQAFWAAGRIAELHPEAWRTLRSEHPDRLALHYITPVMVRSDTTMAGYLNYDYVNQHHPEWFLLKDAQNASSADYRNPSKRMRRSEDSKNLYYNSFYLDIGNPNFQDWAVEEFVGKLDPVVGVNTRVRYSGIAADMVMLRTFQEGRTALHPNWKYAAGGWISAYFSYLGKLHDALKAKGYVLIANHTLYYVNTMDDAYWVELMDIVDGLMSEEAVLKWSPQTLMHTDRFGGTEWECSIQRHEAILNQGLYDWWQCNFIDYSDPEHEYQNFLYSYCSYLLIRNDQLSLFGVHRQKKGVDLDPWYEEYTLPLGNPLGARYQQDSCWLRDYQHGKIVVNPSSSSCTLTFDDENYTLDWRTKRTVTRLTMEPLSATILLPTGYQID